MRPIERADRLFQRLRTRWRSFLDRASHALDVLRNVDSEWPSNRIELESLRDGEIVDVSGAPFQLVNCSYDVPRSGPARLVCTFEEAGVSREDRMVIAAAVEGGDE